MSYEVKCYTILPNKSKRWLVLGKTKEYMVTRTSCTCHDYLLKIAKKEPGICKHLQLLHDSIENNAFDNYEISNQEYRKLRYYLLDLKK